MISRSGTARLHGVVERFAGRRVAVLGDIVVDEFLHGEIARISREAPVLILEHRETIVVPGGGGNAIMNLRALGADPRPISVVGRDGPGDRVVAALASAGVRGLAGILRVSDRPTPTKTRVLAGGVHTRRQQVVRLDRGTHPAPLDPAVARRLRGALARELDRAEGLLIADYGLGSAAPELAGGPARAAVQRGLPVTVDSRWRVAKFRGLTACTPNQEELEQALGLAPLSGATAVARAGATLRRRLGHRAVVVTRGSEGMVLFERGRRPLAVPAFGSDEVADVTGAGDTVVSAFTLALIAGAGLADAVRIANYAAGVVVTKAGTATLTSDELHRAIDEDSA